MTVHPATQKIETPRLVLREWEETDKEPFARMNADPQVMRYFNSVLSRAESDQFIDRMQEHFRIHGFSFWAVTLKEGGALIGLAGLARPRFEAHFTPCVEIGWRFAPDHWGKGYATEAARAAMAEGFSRFRCTEIVSFTAQDNAPSRRVMERLGMQRDASDDFDHPGLPEGHALRRHVLYRMPQDRWARLIPV